MINDYEIKVIDGEEILFLYLNIDEEFSFLHLKKDKLKNVVSDFIRKNKILFAGTIATLVVGGNIIGNVKLDNNQTIAYIPENNIVLNSPNIENIVNRENELEIDLNIETEEKPIEETKLEVKEETKRNTIKPIEKNTNNTESNSKTEEIPKTESVEEDKIITLKRNNGELVSIELEEYILGVVAGEMPAAFNIEALKAQAVIARTYALKALSKGQILSDNESSQSYKSQNELKTLWGNNYNTYYEKIKNAVESTKGGYLTYNGEYIEAVYHSTSNGITENSINVWGNAYPYLINVESPYDNANPSYESEKIISYEILSRLLSSNITEYTEFKILHKTSGNRVGQIKIGENIYSGVEIRNILGLRSADFDIVKNESGISFKTYGYGHGVGMSQYGANGYAKNEYTYKQILEHYYPGTTLNY